MSNMIHDAIRHAHALLQSHTERYVQDILVDPAAWRRRYDELRNDLEYLEFVRDHRLTKKVTPLPPAPPLVMENPGCNWGMVCAASGLVVVDIDIKNVGRDEAWHAWCGVCTSWGLSEPIKPTVQTQSGGWHIYLRIPADTRPDALHQPPLRSGVIDVRANGFVLIPPSQIDGKVYANF